VSLTILAAAIASAAVLIPLKIVIGLPFSSIFDY
jgi:hypothetical protein